VVLHVPGRDELAGDHRRPEADVEAAWDAGRCALQDARPGPRGEREDGVHGRCGAGVPLIFGGHGAMAGASVYVPELSACVLPWRENGGGRGPDRRSR
jgi:hypothetical protein